MKITHTFKIVKANIKAIRNKELAIARKMFGSMTSSLMEVMGKRTTDECVRSAMMDVDHQLRQVSNIDWDERLLDYMGYHLSNKETEKSIRLEDDWSESVEELEEYIKDSLGISAMLEQAVASAEKGEWDEVATIHYNATQRYGLMWPIYLDDVRWSDIRLVKID
jgi:hypothetical protein